MKIAYIITAYKDETHLFRLIKSLDSNSDFYVHIDKKVDITPFEILFQNIENVFFIKYRYSVNWGSFNQLLSQMELLRCVVDSGIEYHRVVCLSGLDYPIFSNAVIADTLSSNDFEYIQAMNLSQTITLSQHLKVTLYHYFRDFETKHVLLKKMLSGISRNIMKLTPFRKKTSVLISDKLVDVYMGSDYWALTFDCAKYVYSKLESEKALMAYFKYTFVPSEMCIHTIIFNSHYSEKAILYAGSNYPGLCNLTPLHYIVYGKSIKIFTDTDFSELVNSGKMFFRKATTDASGKLLDMIDKHRSL
ncbi:beta-1,6-N-acetylglucosaminyltransferase [Spirosoma fluviale]|uniref:Peptide O-xylosyltransferase n=1 Tax=Spirosoma fluviale TaxID=1597977 RepID=A0A286GXD6_9BACT|nr:beta-1,6-N-acetylglucosaminyltransferase [Spirosoma fluviale]SOD99836.1 Core-2/I-Branching enzyme [Spirosoma fluviale]